MADTDRVVYPDEVDDIKASAAEVKPENGDSNSVEETPAEVIPQVQMRNTIVVPANCPLATNSMLMAFVEKYSIRPSDLPRSFMVKTTPIK